MSPTVKGERTALLEGTDGLLIGNIIMPDNLIPPRFIVWNDRVFEARSPHSGWDSVYREVFAWRAG